MRKQPGDAAIGLIYTHNRQNFSLSRTLDSCVAECRDTVWLWSVHRLWPKSRPAYQWRPYELVPASLVTGRPQPMYQEWRNNCPAPNLIFSRIGS